MDYVSIPSYATRLDSQHTSLASRNSPKVASAPPKSDYSTVSPPSPAQQPQTPTKQPFNIPSAILGSGLSFPSPSPRTKRNAPDLLSTREQLSLPTTTANFRRFASKSGPVFWLQDRIEEVVMWKKGWKVTVAWMSAYAFICYFPRLVLAIPHAVLLWILLQAHAIRQPSPSRSVDVPSPPPYTQPAEGSPEWFSNLQAIQNLMGAISDAHDTILYTIVPHLTFSTPYSYSILTCTIISLVLLLFILPFVPLRLVFLFVGCLPLLLTHPLSRTYLPIFVAPHIKRLRVKVARLADDDRLEDMHLRSELKEVELWENERFGGIGGERGFSKVNLRSGERKGWTRGKDGWSDTTSDGGGDVSNLTFALAPGWAFVETEDWRKDLEASWIDVESDADGWIYTNDIWMEPRSAPSEGPLSSGVTRRRRWTRRIYQESEHST